MTYLCSQCMHNEDGGNRCNALYLAKREARDECRGEFWLDATDPQTRRVVSRIAGDLRRNLGLSQSEAKMRAMKSVMTA